jgi:hypothetical protein
LSTPVSRKQKRPAGDDEMKQLNLDLVKEQLEPARFVNHQCRLVNRKHEIELQFPVYSHTFPHEETRFVNAEPYDGGEILDDNSYNCS